MAEIKIIGTAHVSQDSVDEVTAAIDEYTPDVVAIELDPSRFAALKKQARDPTVNDVLEVKNFNSLLVQWLLAYLQRKIGLDVGVEPGAEMKAAIVEAEKRNIPIALVDRDIRITLLRFWNSLGILEKIRMLWALLLSIAEVDGGEEIDIESLKKEDVIDMVMEEFRKFSPNGARALIDERDAFIAHQLVLLKSQLPEGKILAVIGAGHRKGISTYLENPQTLPPFDALTREPKSFPWAKVFGFAVTFLFFFLLAAIAFSGVGWNALIYAFLFWVIIHGMLSAFFVLLAGGHPYSALTCFCVAWMTSLNPMLHAGWIGAYVEARVRNPPISDFRKIYQTESIMEMARIPLFKVVLVAALGNLGSMLGTILYFIFIFPVLGIDPVVVISTGIQNMWVWLTGLI
ncbi:MAG: TraB/GumN family protein [Methanoregula sp.]|uniref:TraB/GumN family protein n=1 Tax=Methanoregula sp. TaxID=2052170 RepID=UPI0025D06EB9|nr:TraB/GumN family protein [Methanoregula sp.]MCK9632855.1 TraB/GumN family protein [Methanoregula sp.]